jgi:hypothetical protein
MCPRGLLRLSSSSVWCHPKIKGEHPDLPIGDIAKKQGEKWKSSTAGKQSHEKKVAMLREKDKKDMLPSKPERPRCREKGSCKAGKSKESKRRRMTVRSALALIYTAFKNLYPTHSFKEKQGGFV